MARRKLLCCSLINETMNIQRAKEEIKNAVRAYLARDEKGELLIPEIHQRPIFLMGPPGIGKTAIMEQAARECGIALAAYSMTHHTRQSAMGLPFIETKRYDGKEYSVTSYTMSEIIASVYEIMENTGLKEGILFIDEINCVSETLSPVMLQFLQAKMFGNTKVPEGWIIVAAGNPAEYNRSVRALDVVTLDRVKMIWIEADYAVWKTYAANHGVHQAILSYLDARRENFYRIETTVDGKRFVTARGWEDLSDMLKASETLGLAVDEQVVEQYLQQPEVAMDFANYLSLYYKYEKAYHVEDILEGKVSEHIRKRVKTASFDERISLVGLLIGSLGSRFYSYQETDKTIAALYDILKAYQKDDGAGYEEIAKAYQKTYEAKRNAGLMERQEQNICKEVIAYLRQWGLAVREKGLQLHDEIFTYLSEAFAARNALRETEAEETAACLEHAFDFMEEMFGQGPELVLFVTELAAGGSSLYFIQENGCERFYNYNRTMLRDGTRQELLAEAEEIF